MGCILDAMSQKSLLFLVVISALPSFGCEESSNGSGGAATTASAATGPAATSGNGATSSTSTTSQASATVSGSGTGTGDPCAGAAFCETFEDYAGVTDLADEQELGPWRAALKTPGASMGLDDTHVVSGARALHVRIDDTVEAGGRLFARGDLPIFDGNPTHVYGRMMMYIDPNGRSVHWTFFGASGDAEASSPEAGRRATYLMSSLPRNDVNTYSFVYGLAPEGSDPFHDCWFQSEEAMPTAGWRCVAFEMDSVSRKLRMTMDGAADPAVSVDDHGQGCVGDVVPDDSGWYGPAIDEIYLGAWSFHPMVGPLDVWIDDLVLDTEPVACPAP
jgi:hypothetical protein